MVLRALHLCSGYGGFELALRLAGIPAVTVAHVERDAYAAATLVARMEDQTLDPAPIWSDLTTFDGAAWRGRVDLVTAGFPCQPFSQAGLRRGVDDERWLWPDIERIIGDVRPPLVFLENVPGVVGAGLLSVLEGLAVLGFDAEWGLLSAAAVGAPHRRERFWLLAHTGSQGYTQRRSPIAAGTQLTEPASRNGHVGDADGTGRPEITRSPHGDEAAHERWATVHGYGAHGAGEDVADTAGVDEREPHHPTRTLARPDTRPDIGGRIFPPSPDDLNGWRQWITEGGPEPQIRRSIDGRPVGLADALHLGGNGLVPQVAAAALVELAHRAGVRLT